MQCDDLFRGGVRLRRTLPPTTGLPFGQSARRASQHFDHREPTHRKAKDGPPGAALRIGSAGNQSGVTATALQGARHQAKAASRPPHSKVALPRKATGCGPLKQPDADPSPLRASRCRRLGSVTHASNRGARHSRGSGGCGRFARSGRAIRARPGSGRRAAHRKLSRWLRAARAG